jgi:CubicO group peptidase (beta-lactamase class C family)
MGSIVVSQNGTLVYSKSVGKADVETNTKASPLTKYRIGSISKMFTSVLILRRSKKRNYP